MHQTLQRHLRDVRNGRPGHRFRDQFDKTATPSAIVRLLMSIAGFTLVVAGVVMLVTPGPGIVVMLIGLAVLSLAFRWAAAVFDGLERSGRRVWNAIPASWKSSWVGRAAFVLMMITGAVAAMASSLYVSQLLLA